MKIYNSLNNKIESFKTIEKNKVKMYVCGPTVYNYIHIGNARPIIVFDSLARFLKKIGYDVKFVQNFTDIDDKIINKSLEENIDISKLTEKYIEAFLNDISQLNVLNDVIRPKVSDNILEIIDMIQNLINKGYAYELNGNVFFRVKKYLEYGKISNQNIDNLEHGIRIESDEKKESPLDFVLWKKRKEHEPYWESPFSKGRPGWHIECSALIKKYLGDKIDIHGGGIDLIFPHHENENAQSVCSCNNDNLANFWLHNGHLEINGEKMSKSLNNFMLLRDILKEYDGNIIRFFMLSTHYRKPIDFSKEGLDSSKKTLESIKDTLNRYKSKINDISNENISKYLCEFEEKYINSLKNDFNTPQAISSIFELINNVNKEIIESGAKELNDVILKIKESLFEVLGVEIMDKRINDIGEKLLELLNKIRDEARANKNYTLSDMIRDELLKIGIKSFDKKNK